MAATGMWAAQGRLGVVRGKPNFAITGPSAALLFFNLLDGVFTLTFLQLGVAEEMNPLMLWAYQASPLWFMVVKLVAVQFGLVLLCQYQASRAAQLALRLGAFVYAVIVAYHSAFLLHLLVH